jgi:phage-related protein
LTHNKKVINLPLGGQFWRFWDYVSPPPGARNLIQDWVDSLSDEARLTFNALLKNIRKVENPLEWTPFRGFLRGKGKEKRIWELGFRADKRQYRVFGSFGPGRKEATLLMGCYHKQKVYTPRDAINEAGKRSKALAERRATRHERQVRDDF